MRDYKKDAKVFSVSFLIIFIWFNIFEMSSSVSMKILINVIILAVMTITGLNLLIQYSLTKPMRVIYEKLEEEIGEFKVISVLNGVEENIKSNPELLILTKTDKGYRIKIENGKYTKTLIFTKETLSEDESSISY